MRRIALLGLLSFFTGIGLNAFAQSGNGVIKGKIYNAKNNEPVPFANIIIRQTDIGTASDIDGEFKFTGIEPGYVELKVSSVGYETYITESFMVTNARPAYIEIPLSEKSEEIEEVRITASPFRLDKESPVSMRRIGVEQIEKSPGANRDISRVIQSFPGVASSVSFRNDIIVRGGGPGENSFYLDEVEIPNINHFATQGASGGPVGIINVDFIREVDFYSGAFPSNRGNALSSVLELKQINGNKDNVEVQGAIGASEASLTFDGPISDNTTFVFSARRSYLQLLFDALELPFLPTFNDFQFKSKTRFNDKNELRLIGLGAIDDFDLNTDANETESQQYILDYIPVNTQRNYTIGAVYKHYRDNGNDTWVLSRNYLRNRSYKYQNNREVDSLKRLDYTSDEAETKFRYENTTITNGYRMNAGLGLEYASYTNNTFRKSFVGGQPFTIDYNSTLDFFQWNLFGQISKSYFNEKLSLSLGIRADANNYSESMSNLIDQASPRFSLSYQFAPEWSLNFNTGRFYQLPPYTTLGFSNQAGDLINKQNGLKYISADHLVGGIQFLPDDESKISIEGFYKNYNDYPYSLDDSISIANKGDDFGSYGDEEVKSVAEGRAYGLELLFRHQNLFDINMILSYTYVRSEFRELNNQLEVTSNYIPSSWDNRHLLKLTATREFKNNWQLGMKWRFVGGSPYTPLDRQKSAQIAAWDARGRAYPDYDRLNSKRLNPFHQLDLRVDKQYFFDNWSLMLYFDVQNVYDFTADEPPVFIRKTNEEGEPLVEPNNPGRYVLKQLDLETSGNILPSLGIIVEF
ncbi:MAG: TonB-dependent receptor [Bacteroidales bacterium]|nr:TonB-dependent receptor [Bacteroidales bacterium]